METERFEKKLTGLESIALLQEPFLALVVKMKD